MRLYPWQQQCLHAWTNHNCRGIAHVVTGAGKTFLALSAIDRYREKYPDAVVRIVVPTIPLALQWQTALLHHAESGDDRPGFCGGGAHDSPDQRIMIYIVNSARAFLPAHIRRSFSLGQHVLLICDECHHYQSSQNRKIFSFLDSARPDSGLYASLGLSATPFDIGDSGILLRSLGPVIFRYDFDAAAADGIVSPFSVCETAVSFLPEERRAYGQLSLEIGIILQKLYKAYSYLETLSPDAFLKAVTALAREQHMDPSHPAVAYLLLCWKRKDISVLASSRLLCGISLIRQLPPASRVLIFSERISQAEAMAAMIRRKLGPVCAVYHSGMTREARNRNMQAFRDREYRVLVSCRCLDEGIDVPDASVGIVLSGASVPRQRIQRLGRILRRSADKAAATLYYLYIQESAEDRCYLPGLESSRSVSLHYSAAEQVFSGELYEYAAAELLRECSDKGYSDAALKETRRCLIEGLPRTDYLLPAETLLALQAQAGAIHDRNYFRVMNQMRQRFSGSE